MCHIVQEVKTFFSIGEGVDVIDGMAKVSDGISATIVVLIDVGV